MRRVARHLLTLCSAVSLLLAVAASLLWVRSHYDQDSVWWMRPGRAVSIQSSQGRIGVYAVTSSDFTRTDDGTLWIVAPTDLTEEFVVPPHSRTLGGFVLTSSPPGWRRYHNVLVPYWCVVGVALVLPLFRLRAWWQSRGRRRAGRCLKCGYDLRASPARCPECGATTPAPAVDP